LVAPKSLWVEITRKTRGLRNLLRFHPTISSVQVATKSLAFTCEVTTVRTLFTLIFFKEILMRSITHCGRGGRPSSPHGFWGELIGGLLDITTPTGPKDPDSGTGKDGD
jgi:hypothetical protein